MAWTAPRTWVTSETVTAAIMNIHVRDNLLETSAATVTTAGDIPYADAANSMGSRLAIGGVGSVLVTDGTDPVWAEVVQSTSAEDDATTSTSYVDYDIGGVPGSEQLDTDAVTGARALVFYGASVDHDSAGGQVLISYRVSGATTIAASDTWFARSDSNAANDVHYVSRVHLRSSLTAGTNTFTLTYRTSSGTANIRDGYIGVIPLS